MAKFKTSVSRKFEIIEEENEQVTTTEEDNIFYMRSKYVQNIFEDTDSEISDEEEY